MKETNVKQQQTLDGFTTDITEMKKTEAELKETSVKHQQSINGFTNEISTLKKKDTEINETLVKQQQSLTGFTTEVNNLKKTDKELSETLVKQQQSLTGFSNEISNLKKTDTELNQTLVKQQQTLNGFTNEISTLKKTDTELKETTVKQQQSITGISNSIVEVNKSISGQSQKINSLESTVDGNKKLIQKVEKDTDSLGVGIGELKKETTEIKEEAGKLSTKLEKVEARTVGVENWFEHTGKDEKPKTIGMGNGAIVNKAGQSFYDGYVILECTDHTDSFYQFHLDQQKMGDYEKGKDMTISLDIQNDVRVDIMLFQNINNAWNEQVYKNIPAGNWRRESWTFRIDERSTGWGLRLRFERNEISKGKKFRMAKAKLEKGSVPTDYSRSTYELEQSYKGVKERIESVEVKTNDMGDRNYIRNGGYTDFYTDNGLAWDKNLNGNLRADWWSTGYNAGVPDPTKGYHAHINEKRFGFPVLALINRNVGQVGAKRWLGFSQNMGMQKQFVSDLQPGDYFTVSFDLWTSRVGDNVATGLHHFIEGNATQNFHSGQTEVKSTVAQKWHRVHATFKLHDKYEANKGSAFYLYGDRDADGTDKYVKNISLVKGRMPLGYAPSPEDSVDVKVFNQKVTEITKDAEGIKTDVKKVTEVTTEHGKQITQSQTQMKQLSDEMSAKMSTKQVEDYVAGVGMTNILRNADLKTGLKVPYFGLTQGTTITDSKYRSFNTFWSDKTGRTADDWQGAISNRYPCQADEDFVASCWFISDNPASIDKGAVMEVEQFNSAGTRIRTDNVSLKPLTTWQRASFKVKTVANAVTITWRYYAVRNGRLRVGMPMLQRGTVASEFQVNPADIADVDALREDIAQRIATEEFNRVVTNINREIKANGEGILLKADSDSVYTKQQADGTFAKEAHVKTLEAKIQVNERNINLSVKENDIISKINISKETISIEARRINLIGFVTAQHIKGSVLEGVRIKTAPSGKQRWVELNEQHINMYDKGVNRMYYGFYDSGNDVQPTIVLGKGSVGDLLGAMVFHQTTPGGNNFNTAYGRIGMVHRTENGDLLMNASIEFQRDGGNLLHHCWGQMNFRSNTQMMFETNGILQLTTNFTDGAKNVNVIATNNFDVMAHNNVWMNSNQTQYYQAGNGRIEFAKKDSGKPGIKFNLSNVNDADINFGTDITLRSSNVTGYTGNMQIKNWDGTAFRDLEVRDVKHYGRISQVSKRQLKQAIKDVEFDSLEKIMDLELKSYYMKSEIERLYEMRENRKEDDPLPTYNDIDISYGFIVENTDPVFQVPKGDAMDMYAIATIHIDATQNINRRLVEAERVIETQNDTIKNQNDRIYNIEKQLSQVLELIGKE